MKAQNQAKMDQDRVKRIKYSSQDPYNIDRTTSVYATLIYDPIFLGLDPKVPYDDLETQSKEPPNKDWKSIKKCLVSDK